MLAALTLSGVRPARAHAPPEIRQILFRDATPGVLLTNRGVVFGAEPGQTPRIVCIEALHINTGEYPRAALTRAGTVLIATSAGLLASADQGCTWSELSPLQDALVPALVQHPTDADTLFVTSFGSAPAVWVTHDGGTTFESLLTLADKDYARSLLLAPSNPDVLYSSGEVYGDGSPPVVTHYVARSQDAGKTWERHTVALAADELDVTLLAVHPTRPDVLLARASGATPINQPERLLVSEDGGRTFSSPFALLALHDAAFAPSNHDALVSGLGGLFRARAGLADFQRVGASERVTVLAPHGALLWASGSYLGLPSTRDGLALSRDEGAHYDGTLDFAAIDKPVVCAPTSKTAQLCEVPWRDYFAEIALLAGTTSAPDAGTTSVPVEVDAGLLDAGFDGAEDAPIAHDAGPTPVDASAAVDAASRPRGHADGCEVRRDSDRTAPSHVGGVAWLLCALALLARSARRTRR
ncbi:MAG: hypothetical protein RLZZ450_3182 [Pseudomonadota bacterium]